MVAAGDEVVLDGAVEQLRGAVDVQGLRQLARTFRGGQAIRRIVLAAAFADQVLVQPARGRKQPRQAAAGKPLLVQAGNEGAQIADCQRLPGADAGLLAECQDLAQIALVTLERVPGKLALAAQMVDEGVEFVLHGGSSG
ncbi:hypothetical protein D3C81_1141430 [compost metagenome]